MVWQWSNDDHITRQNINNKFISFRKSWHTDAYNHIMQTWYNIKTKTKWYIIYNNNLHKGEMNNTKIHYYYYYYIDEIIRFHYCKFVHITNKFLNITNLNKKPFFIYILYTCMCVSVYVCIYKIN